VDVRGLLTVRKKELQGKDKLTAEIADNAKAFKVNLPSSVKLKIHMCSLRFTKNKPLNLEHSTF